MKVRLKVKSFKSLLIIRYICYVIDLKIKIQITGLIYIIALNRKI